MRTRISLTAALAAATLFVTPAAIAQQDEWWTEWDNNEDGLLSDQEFGTVYSNSEIFSDADTDQDGMWSQEEILQTGYMSEEEFIEADADGDGMLTEDQTMDAIFTYWDTDESGSLDEDELSAREPMDMMGGDTMETDT